MCVTAGISLYDNLYSLLWFVAFLTQYKGTCVSQPVSAVVAGIVSFCNMPNLYKAMVCWFYCSAQTA